MTGGYTMKEKNIRELAKHMGLVTVENMCQYTITQLVYMIANKVNELVDEVWRFETDVTEVVKSQNEKIQHLLGEGLLSEVEIVFNGWIEDGTFNTLINQSALKKVNERIDETNAQLSNVNKTKRDINVKLSKDDMDTSSDATRLGLQNLNDEVHALLRGSGGTVNAEIKPGSITTELLADGCVTNEKNSDNGLFLNQNTIYPLVNINESELNQSPHKNPVKKGILDIKILNANMEYEYKLCYISKNNAAYGDLIIIRAMNKNGTVAYDLFPTVKTTYPNTGVQTHHLTAQSPYKEKVIITLNYDHLEEINDFHSHDGYPTFHNRIAKQCLIPSSSISYDEALFDHVTLNKGKDFPLVISDGTINKYQLTEALLDIKIMNAKKNHDYKVRYITKNQANFYGDLILINRINRETKAESYLFDTKKVTYPITDRNGISTLVLNAEDGTETVILTIDYSAIPDGFVPLADDIDTNVWQRNIVHPSQLILESETAGGTNGKNSLHINYSKSSENIKVTAKSGLTHDVELDFRKVKPNDLMAVWYGKIGKNSNPYPLPISSPVANLGSGSDWIGPYIVKAINNGDGNGRIYTGGSHSKANTMEGDATARTKRYQLFVDGVLMTNDFNGYCSSFDLHVENEIMGYNTRDLNRYILLEKVHYKMVDSELKVKVDIFPLEDVVIEEYYGMQIVSGTLDSVYYLGGENGDNDSPQGSWQAHNSGANNFVDTMLINKDGVGGVFMKMDKTCGLGLGEYIPDSFYHCHTSTYGKSYFNLINGNTNKTPNHLFWCGSYDFKTL